MRVQKLTEARSWDKCAKTGGKKMLKFLSTDGLAPIKQKLATKYNSFKMI